MTNDAVDEALLRELVALWRDDAEELRGHSPDSAIAKMVYSAVARELEYVIDNRELTIDSADDRDPLPDDRSEYARARGHLHSVEDRVDELAELTSDPMLAEWLTHLGDAAHKMKMAMSPEDFQEGEEDG